MKKLFALALALVLCGLAAVACAGSDALYLTGTVDLPVSVVIGEEPPELFLRPANYQTNLDLVNKTTLLEWVRQVDSDTEADFTFNGSRYAYMFGETMQPETRYSLMLFLTVYGQMSAEEGSRVRITLNGRDYTGTCETTPAFNPKESMTDLVLMIEVGQTDRDGNIRPVPRPVPVTGDATPVFLLAASALASAGAMLPLLRKKRNTPCR